MSSSTPTTTEERRRNDFLAARAVFTDQNAFIRDRNAVEKLVSRHERSFRRELLHLDKQPIIDMTLSLLRKQVFESEEKAKLVFPELYHVSAVRRLQHDTSEENAARSEAKAQEEVSRSEDVKYEADEVDGQEGYLEGPYFLQSSLQPSLTRVQKDTPIAEVIPEPAETSSSTLFPAYLSYAVQHKLLNAVQRLLEECCYDFARTWVPSVLEEHNWDCAEAVEIIRWSEVLPFKFAEIDADATSLESWDDLLEALKAISPLRHAAVHRLPTSVKGVEQMLDKALHLVQVLHDDIRTSKMETIVEDFRASREDMEIHKTNLENQLDQQLRDIREQRAALDRKAQEAKENMARQDMENTKAISSLFERSISNITFDSSKIKPVQREFHEPKPNTPENGMHVCSDAEPMQPNRHEPEIGMSKHHETANGNLEHKYGEYHKAEPDAPKQDEGVGDDLRPTDSEPEADPVRNPKHFNDHSEPMPYETGLDPLDDDGRPWNGFPDVFDSGIVGQGHNTDSDIDSTHSESDIVPPAGCELEEHGILDIRHKRWYRERYQR